MDDDIIKFGSAEDALRFAYKYYRAQLPPPPMVKMMKLGANIGTGKGLVGYNAAHQAGNILRKVRGLSDPNDGTYAFPGAMHFITARYAPHGDECHCGAACCSKHKPSKLWFEATDWIADESRHLLTGRVQYYHLRIGIVRRFFGEKLTMSALAEHSGANRNTASEHNGIVTTWLKKEQNRAVDAITDALKASGRVE